MSLPEGSERARLDAAYRRTAYRVELPDGPAVLRVDMAWSDIDARLTGGATSLAYLTAVNPGSQPLSVDENARRQRALLDDIMKLGGISLPGSAVADDGAWPDEPGCLVAGLHQVTALALAERYGQNAFLHAQVGGAVRLIWCDVNKSSLESGARQVE